MPLNSKFTLISKDGKNFIVPKDDSGVENFEPFEINEPAAYIYRKLEEGLPTKKIASKMCLVYMAGPDELETDIMELLVILNRKGIYYE